MSAKNRALTHGAIAMAALSVLLAFTGCGGGEDGHEDEQARQLVRSATSALTLGNLPPPAPRPTEYMSLDQTCATPTCHAHFLVQRVKHAPVIGQQCGACHGEDAGGHVFPLLRPGNETCTFCHSAGGAATTGQPRPVDAAPIMRHAPVDDPGCITCHDPHGSMTRALLTSATGQLCRECHDLPLLDYAHSAYADGQCTLCHDPHESANVHLLKGGQGNDFCYTCHENIGRLMHEADTNVHEPAKGECTTCHSPHSSPARFLLPAPVSEHCGQCHEQTVAKVRSREMQHGAVTDEKSCANCHSPHASAQVKLLVDREDRMCLNCHAQPLPDGKGRMIEGMAPVLARRSLHGPVKTGDCSTCHDSHGADFANLLREPFPDAFYSSFELQKYNLCFKCHSADLVRLEETDALTGFRNGVENLHFVHVNKNRRGRSCRACHNNHASNQPLHMRETVSFGDWQMPLGFEKNPQGGSCTPGCHEPMSYRRDSPIANQAQ